MPATYSPGDRVRVRWAPNACADGTVWSYGPDDASYWVIPDQPVPNMIQGCIKASLHLIEELAGDTLW